MATALLTVIWDLLIRPYGNVPSVWKLGRKLLKSPNGKNKSVTAFSGLLAEETPVNI